MSAVHGLRVRDLTGGRAPSEDLSGYRVAEAGDLVVNKLSARDGALGVARQVGIVSPAYWVLVPDLTRVEPTYLHYMLRSKRYLGEIGRRSKYMPPAQFDLPWEQFRTLPLELPSLEEQRRVADFLDDQVALLDRAIHLRQQQLGLVSRRFHSEARRATTFGLEAGPTKPTRLAWMPTMAAKWTRGRVARSFRTGSGTTPPASQELYFDGPYDWVNTGDLRDGLIVRPKRTVTDLALSDYSTLRRYPAGSLVIAMYGATIGRLGLLSRPACVNQACCVLYEGTDVTTLFAFYWLLAYRDEITDLAVGAGQPNISQETVSSLPLPVPAQFEQETIVAHLERERERSEALADTLTRSISLLQERKQALITTAVTCELDVATASARSVA